MIQNKLKQTEIECSTVSTS